MPSSITLLLLSFAAFGAPPDGDALAVLEKAAIFQRGDEPRKAPRSLHGRFYVTVETPEGRFNAKVERWFALGPARIRTSRHEQITGSRTTVAFDGRRAWMRDDESGEVVVYTDKPETFEADIEFLEEQIRITRLVLESAVLDALIPRLDDLAYVGGTVWTDIDEIDHAAEIVTATAPDDFELFVTATDSLAPPDLDAPEPRLALRLVIDRETGALWSLEVAAHDRPEAGRLRLEFDLHGPTPSGLRVPANIRIYVDDEDRPAARLGVDYADADLGLLMLELGGSIDDALFTVPEDD